MSGSEENANDASGPESLQDINSQSEYNFNDFIRKAHRLIGKSANVLASDEKVNNIPGLLIKFEPCGDDPIKIEEIHHLASGITFNTFKVPHEYVTEPGRVRDVMINSSPNHDYVTV